MAKYFNDYDVLMNPADFDLCNFCKYENEDCPVGYDVREQGCIRHTRLTKIIKEFCDNLNKMVEQEQNEC